MKIGEVIMNLRKQKGIKQKDLANSLGISATYLSLVEHGQQKPSIFLIAKVADFFDLPVTSIFFKAVDIRKIKNKQAEDYFEKAKPIIDDIINYLLSGDNAPKEKAPITKIKKNLKPRTKA